MMPLPWSFLSKMGAVPSAGAESSAGAGIWAAERDAAYLRNQKENEGRGAGQRLNEKDLFIRGERPEETGGDDAEEKKEFDRIARRAEAQSPDEPRREEAVVEPLVRRKRLRRLRKVEGQPEDSHPERLIPEKHFEDEKINVQQRHEPDGDMGKGGHAERIRRIGAVVKRR